MHFITHPYTSGPNVSKVFTFLDMFSGIASILHLMAISMERYFCVGWAIKHRNAPKYIYYIMVVVIWLLSALVASIRLISPTLPQTDLTLLIVVVFFLLPLVVIVISYAAIWKIAITRMGNNPTKRSLKREIRTASTIAFVIGFFFITWSPFFILQSVFVFCGGPCMFAGLTETLVFLKLLHYLNSAMNPVVYGVRIPEFRKTFKFILKKLYGPILSIARR
ncbi:hypothetical protein QZH41_001255 [Actinostola sp. cb2023]|nr:hypothetical protein QZH41_001255 [Actinostola sp. cb2023]